MANFPAVNKGDKTVECEGRLWQVCCVNHADILEQDPNDNSKNNLIEEGDGFTPSCVDCNMTVQNSQENCGLLAASADQRSVELRSEMLALITDSDSKEAISSTLLTMSRDDFNAALITFTESHAK